MSHTETLAKYGAFLDLSEATKYLVANGDVLEFLGKEAGGITCFRSKAKNVMIKVPQHLLRSLYFRAYTEEITIEPSA